MAEQTISLVKATDLRVEVPCTDTNGNPLDMTTGSAAFRIGRGPGVPLSDVVLTKTSDPGGGILITGDATLWLLELSLTVADTEDLPPRLSYYYEFEVVVSSGEKYQLAAGVFELTGTMFA